MIVDEQVTNVLLAIQVVWTLAQAGPVFIHWHAHVVTLQSKEKYDAATFFATRLSRGRGGAPRGRGTLTEHISDSDESEMSLCANSRLSPVPRQTLHRNVQHQPLEFSKWNVQ
jgi:hypothetical protein